MLDCSRRKFIYGLGSFALLPFLRAQEPDLILYNGNIWTVDGKQPRAEAVAISSGRFVAVDPIKRFLPLPPGGRKKLTSSASLCSPDLSTRMPILPIPDAST